ncbi:MAG: putative Ig domain-containing protein [Bacteroidales bacterium]|nr:putative Ig domain-containing protein [Bacteroidales bacterium]MBN2698813.1 putative Ig domain-containing protein [Bacteroidales bacterium]
MVTFSPFRTTGHGKNTLFGFLILSFLFIILSLSSAANKEIFVSPDGGGDGSSASSPTTFQLALDDAHSDADTIFIYLLEGSYDAGSGPFTYSLAADESRILSICGGVTSTGAFTGSSENTVLDGNGTGQILKLRADASNSLLKAGVSHLTFKNGFASDDGNASTIDHGGAIMAHEGNADSHGAMDLNIYDCYFENNKTTGSINGGAIYSNVTLEIAECCFVKNEASNGGAIIAYTGPDGDQGRICRIEKTDFEENKNYGNQGSTIWHSITLEARDCFFSGMNDGSRAGPGSCVWGNRGSTHKISRCLFKDIIITYWGSAIQSFGGNAIIDNCIFENNKAGETGDGYGTLAFYHDNQPPTIKRITNCTFVGNRSKYPESSIGGALHNRGITGDDFVVANCIFYDNGLSPVYSSSTNAVVKYSFTSHPYLNVTNGGGNISGENPLFADEEYRLQETSTCVNKGTNDAEPAMERDFDGNRRILSGTIDMGAYEINHPPDVIILSEDTLAENSGAGITVGTLTANDPDEEDMEDLEFALIDGDGLNDLDNFRFTIEGNLLIALENFDFEEKNSLYIRIGVMDYSGACSDSSMVINITDKNDPVLVNGSIDNQVTVAYAEYDFTFDEELFSDQDEGDALSYSASLEDESALPGWLDFDDTNRNFNGTPVRSDTGTYAVKITASDNRGSIASVTFNLSVENNVSVEKPDVDHFRLYPNPASNEITVQIPSNQMNHCLKIYNSKGIPVKEIIHLHEGLNSISIKDLPAGLYYISTGIKGMSPEKFMVR